MKWRFAFFLMMFVAGSSVFSTPARGEEADPAKFYDYTKGVPVCTLESKEKTGEYEHYSFSYPSALQTEERLKALGYKNIKVKTGRIDFGWAEFAPYDVIVITNPIDFAPQQAVNQLMPNGRIIMPLRDYWGKKLIVLTKTPKGNSYDISATLVTPVLGDMPSETKEAAPDQKENAKWGASKDSKWMKKR